MVSDIFLRTFENVTCSICKFLFVFVKSYDTQRPMKGNSRYLRVYEDW